MMELTKQDMDNISGIMQKHGYTEWSMVGFNPAREYNIFSLFADHSIIPLFRAILLDMVAKIDKHYGETWH